LHVPAAPPRPMAARTSGSMSDPLMIVNVRAR
jgi:hypothetical protein